MFAFCKKIVTNIFSYDIIIKIIPKERVIIMKTSFLKRLTAFVLTAALLFCFVPHAFAAGAPATTAQTTQDDDIRDDPTFQGAVIDIVKSFAKAFVETVVRYVKFIIQLIKDSQKPAEPEIPDTPADVDVQVEDWTPVDMGEVEATAA